MPAMEMKQSGLWKTAILISNIHCASCVSHIQKILAHSGNALDHVDIDTTTKAVHVRHEKSLPASKLCHSLSNAAFEVLKATTSDGNGIIMQELGAEDLGDAWLEAAADLCRPPVRASTNEAQCLQLPIRGRNSTHLANCDACRKESVGSSREDANSFNEKLIDHEPADLGLANREQYDLSALEEGRSSPMFEQTSLSDCELQGPKATAGRFEAILSIGGMTCASCTSAINHGLSDLPYVESVNVTLMTNSAVVVFRGKENLENIVEAVEDLGYDGAVDRCNAIDHTHKRAESPNHRRTVTLKTEGMFCKHCPPRVVDGIKAEYPDLVTIERTPTLQEPIIRVNYVPDPPAFTVRSIVATIDALHESFSTNIYTPPSIEQRSQALQKREQFRLLKRLIFSFIVAIPTLLIGVVWMSLVPSSNITRQFFEKEMWSGTVSRAEWALFILATPVFFLAADVFHVRAIKELRILWRRESKVPVLQRLIRFGSMNLLVSAGTSIAYFASVAVLAIDATTTGDTSGPNSTYFDTVVFLTFFILVGRYLEAYSKAKTGNAIGMLGNLRPQEAVLVTSSALPTASSLLLDGISENEPSETGEKPRRGTQRINASFLEVGDLVIVSHGSSPPADGIIVEGSTKFNESSLTGEARAVAKRQGDTVFSGAINVGDPISVRITEVGGSSILDQVVAVVREGQTKRAPVERVVDIVTGYFVPVITALAIMTFVVWLSLGLSGALSPRYLGSQRGGWAFWSLEFAIAVFVVACPCGIGLAAPTALFVGGGLAACHGILVRGGGEAFQEASNIDAVVFDKTGTLTEGGDLKVTDYEMLAKGDEAEVAWAIMKSLEESSSHPLARALLELALGQSLQPIKTVSITEEPGLGLRGKLVTETSSPENTTYEAALGSEALIASLNPTPDNLSYFTNTALSKWKSQSKSIALLAIRKVSEAEPHPWTLATTFAISDPIRPTALPTVSALQKSGVPVYMLTGDNPVTAAAVASTLSIPLDHVFAGVLPTEKASKIRWLQENSPRRAGSSSWLRLRPKANATEPGSKRATVAFVGDGINDAPALTTADVSISLSSASDIAMHSSSFILLSSSLTSVLTLFQLSERVFRRVKLNFGWAVIYNVILVPVAAGCFFKVKEDGWRLGPVWGSAAMALSSLSVVLSSLALKWEGSWGNEREEEGRR